MFDRIRAHRTVVRTLAAAFILGSLSIGVAYAATPTPTSTTSPAPSAQTGAPSPTDQETADTGQADTGTQDQQPATAGSIPAPQTADAAGQSEDTAALQSLAKISADQAKTAALAQFPGATVQSVTLEDENGSVVYGVSLTDSAGKAQVVKVDGGNAKVLSVEADGGEGGSATEAAGATETTGVEN